MINYNEKRRELFEKIEVQLKEVNEVAFHLFGGMLLAKEIDKAIDEKDYKGDKVIELIRKKERRLSAELEVLSKLTKQLFALEPTVNNDFVKGLDDLKAIQARVQFTVVDPSIELIAKGLDNPDGSDVFKLEKVNNYLRKAIYGATKTSLEGLEKIIENRQFMRDVDEDDLYDY